MSEETCLKKEAAIKIVEDSLRRCRSIQPKFRIGCSQHTLLKNRIHALCVGQTLLEEQEEDFHTSYEEVKHALAPLRSIQHKCERAQEKYEEGSRQYQRYVPMIEAMKLLLVLLHKQLEMMKPDDSF